MNFEQIVSDCEHPFEELKKIAESKKIEPSKLDFVVIGISLYIKSSPSEPFLIANDELIEKARHDESFILNPEIELKERYDIKVYTINETEKTTLSVMLTANKSLSAIEALIRKESIISINEHIAEDILRELQKIKIKHGLLLTIYQNELKMEVDELAKKISRDKGIIQEHKITLCRYFEPEHVVDAKLIHRYKEKLHKNEDRGRVDFSKRDFAIGVSAGEIIMTYQKPKAGTKGRDCKGKFIKPVEPRVDDAPNFTIDSSIKARESDSVIDYIAQKNGYVAFENGVYQIKDELDIKELNFKETGSLLLGVDSGMKLRVQSSNPMQDAIGEGIEVSVSDIEVKGNISKAVQIDAKRVHIDGQTHATSIINADEAIVSVHKGKIKAKKATVNRLEGGEIEADEILIEQAIGGTIKGRDILIRQLHSHSQVYASNLIELHKVIGGENRFFITPLALQSTSTEVETLKGIIDELEMSTKKNSVELQKKSEIVKGNIDVINDLKNKIAHYKSSNQHPPETLSHKLREFLLIIKQLDELKNSLRIQKEKLENSKKRLKEISSWIFSAKVVAMQRWSGFNEIKFQSIEPKFEISYVPKSNEKVIYLEHDENDKVVIKTKS